MPSLSAARADARAIRAGMKDMDELGAAQEYLGYWLPEGDRRRRRRYSALSSGTPARSTRPRRRTPERGSRAA